MFNNFANCARVLIAKVAIPAITNPILVNLEII